MPGFNGAFDATNIAPEQGFAKHPIGKKFPAIVKMTSCEPVNNNPNKGYFSILFETQAGQVAKNYNLWHDNPITVEISNKQLSAVCWATGIFKLDWSNEGAALRGAQLMIDVDFQRGQEPTAEKPAGGYVEVSKVYDRNGNEPGMRPAGAPQAQPPQQQAWGATAPANPPANQPMTQQPGGNWGTQQPSQQQQPAQQPQQQAPGWTQQQPQAGDAKSPPPWAR